MPKLSPLLTRRRTLWLMGGMASGLALHACRQPPGTSSGGNGTSASTGSTLWLGFLPMYIALEKGFFAEGGLDLDYRVFSGAVESHAAYGSGKLQGFSNVTSEAVSLLAKNIDYRIIQIADTSLGGDGILARNSITDITDFKGKKVAVELNGVSHFFLLQVLREAGLSAEDVEVTSLDPAAAATAYQAGQVEIAVTYAPHLTRANDAQSDGRVIYDTSKMPTAIIDAYMFNPAFIARHPDAVQAYVNGIFKGRAFLETNKDEALAIGAKRLGQTPEEVAADLQGVDLTSPENNLKMLADESSNSYLLSHMQELGQFLADQGQIEAPPSVETLQGVLDPTFVKAYQA